MHADEIFSAFVELERAVCIQEQGQELQKQAATIAKQQKKIEALIAGLQKVSAQVEMSHLPPQIVVNDQ